MRLLMNAELSISYAEWKKVYDGHKWARDEANIKEILVGWCEEDQRIHVWKLNQWKLWGIFKKNMQR